jgi:archaemetzincin
MKSIRLVSVGAVERRLIENLRGTLALHLQVACSVESRDLDPAFALHEERGQYHSTALLGNLGKLRPGETIVGVAAIDLYIPILTFVFGEAALGGDTALVSYHRLREEFYGLSANDALLGERLVKEAIHEAGHAAGLTHCEDYECVMAASHSVEWLDLKGTAFCEECGPRFHSQPGRA